VGYSPQSKPYKLYNLVNGKLIISKDMAFNEAEDVLGCRESDHGTRSSYGDLF